MLEVKLVPEAPITDSICEDPQGQDIVLKATIIG